MEDNGPALNRDLPKNRRIRATMDDYDVGWCTPLTEGQRSWSQAPKQGHAEAPKEAHAEGHAAPSSGHEPALGCARSDVEKTCSTNSTVTIGASNASETTQREAIGLCIQSHRSIRWRARGLAHRDRWQRPLGLAYLGLAYLRLAWRGSEHDVAGEGRPSGTGQHDPRPSHASIPARIVQRHGRTSGHRSGQFICSITLQPRSVTSFRSV